MLCFKALWTLKHPTNPYHQKLCSRFHCNIFYQLILFRLWKYIVKFCRHAGDWTSFQLLQLNSQTGILQHNARGYCIKFSYKRKICETLTFASWKWLYELQYFNFASVCELILSSLDCIDKCRSHNPLPVVAQCALYFSIHSQYNNGGCGLCGTDIEFQICISLCHLMNNG
jgi:hypothetical protein